MVCRAMRGGRNINFTFNRRVKSPVFLWRRECIFVGRKRFIVNNNFDNVFVGGRR